MGRYAPGGDSMRIGVAIWVMLVLAAAGCRTPAPVVPCAPPSRPVSPPELSAVEPVPPNPDVRTLPKGDSHFATPPAGTTYRGLSEEVVQRFAAQNAALANQLDDENRVPPPPNACPASTELRRTIRRFTALELRNRSAADALERFFQLADVETRTAILKQTGPILDPLRKRAAEAKVADIRYPLDPADLDRQRSQLASQLVQAEAGVKMLNIDLKRRLGLPANPAAERLWPTGDFDIDPKPIDAEEMVAAALKDRPELRGLRAVYLGLTPDTLPTARDVVQTAGASTAPVLNLLQRCLAKHAGPDPAALAELEVRKKQLWELTAERERGVADETRAAVVQANGQLARIALARDRVDAARAKLEDAARQREAKLPNADLLEAQAKVDWLTARAELAGEVMAWHAARVKLKAALGWLAWETVPESPPNPPR